MIITREYLDQHRTNKGAWTKKQLSALGVGWPPKSGWRCELEGQEISADVQKQFENAKSAYAKTPKTVNNLYKSIPVLKDDQLIRMAELCQIEIKRRKL